MTINEVRRLSLAELKAQHEKYNDFMKRFMVQADIK